MVPWPFWLKRVGASPSVLYPMAAADVCFAAAAQAGRIWKRHRKGLPPSAKALLAEFLLDLRLHILPDDYLDAASNIGRSKYDIRGVTELLKALSQGSDPKVEQVASGPLPCPPPPPPHPRPPISPSGNDVNDLESFRRSKDIDLSLCKTAWNADAVPFVPGAYIICLDELVVEECYSGSRDQGAIVLDF